MKKLELTKDELEKLYYPPPKDVEKETEFQITYRIGRNSLVLELIKKINEELTPYIEYHPNGNVYIKGQRNSKGQEEGIEEWFYPNGNIKCRIPYKEGKMDGIEERFDKQGNITKTYVWKDGELIETTKPELTPHIEYYSNRNVSMKGQLNSKAEREGIWEMFYDNGNIQCKTPYKEGKMNGIKELFYPNGNIQWRIPYKEDKEDGIVEFFYENGNIIETTLWKDGELIEETKPELTPYVEYHDNGNVYVKGQKNSGRQEEGIWEWFFENGNIRLRIPFKEGKEDGIEEWFHPNGNITKTRLWKDGKLIKETKHKNNG